MLTVVIGNVTALFSPAATAVLCVPTDTDFGGVTVTVATFEVTDVAPPDALTTQ